MTLAFVMMAALTVGACGSSRLGDRDSAGPSTTESGQFEAGSSSHTLEVGGVPREYRTYVPESLDRDTPAPVVVMLHGGFGSAAQAERSYGWDAKADAAGFVVVYPDGAGRAWNAGTCCGAPAKDGVDDVGFITAVVADVKARVAVDPARIYVTGMSNGAMMAERLACETNLFAAAASVAGAQMVSCDHPAAISMLHIHGADDHNVPMDGSPGDGRGNVPAHPSTTATIDAWRKVNGCDLPETTTDGSVTRSISTCPNGRAVELIVVADAGHQWPGASKHRDGAARILGMDQPSDALNATDEVWNFFAAHPLPA